MTRIQSKGKFAQSNKDNIIEKYCPICHHGRAWKSRGETSPSYKNKCCRCGHIWRFGK